MPIRLIPKLAMPDPLPRTITVSLPPPLIRAIFTYLEHSDLSQSKLCGRAIERELIRQARKDKKFKTKLEKVMQNGTHWTIDNSAANDGD